MKTLFNRFSVIFAVSLFCFSFGIAGGFQLNEHGARAMAQGGAWAARAYDASAIYFNPAGLAFQNGTQLYLGSTIIVPSMTFFGPLPSVKETKMVDQIFPPINLYGTYAVTEDLHVGLGVNNPFGLGTEWPDNWVGNQLSVKVDLQSFFITPTVAYKINDQLSVGAGFNVVTGSVTLSRYFIPGVKVALDLSATGYGFNLGAQYKVSDDLSLGASYRSSVKLDATGTAKFTPSIPGSTPDGDAAASIELPSTAFLGVAYKVMDNLEVEADYQYVGWSSYKTLIIEFKKDPSKNSVNPKDYQNTYILRIGGEYTMDQFQFRAGYIYDHTPVETKHVDPLLPDANRNGINIGLGYKITNNLNIDFSYMYLKFNQRTVTGTDFDNNGNPGQTYGDFDGTYQASANLFGLNIGYSF
ncbi:MAG: outer membrane protein transport protein [Bacteroidetes bacterium]|nr:outer membrane protein transport protein [Bacteroidota bacterium]